MSERRSIEKAAAFSAELHNPSLLDKVEGISKGLDSERNKRKAHDAEQDGIVNTIQDFLDGTTRWDGRKWVTFHKVEIAPEKNREVEW